MAAPFGTYSVVGWKNGERTVNIEGLGIDGARHIAQVHAGMFGEATRIHFDGDQDYVETFCPHGSTRRGTFGQATMIRVDDRGAVAICCDRA